MIGRETTGFTYDDATIRSVLNSVKRIAMVGASAKTVRPSYFVLKYLLAKGFDVLPVNPGLAGQRLLGQPCYGSLGEIEGPIDMVDIFRSSDAVPGIVEEAMQLSPRPSVIWMQLGIHHEAAAAKAEGVGMTVVMDRCPKIEYARLSREIGWSGVNSRVLSSKKPILAKGYQSYGLSRPTTDRRP